MARTATPVSADLIQVDLARLLSRLENKLPPSTANIHSSFDSSQGRNIPSLIEQRKIAANLEYARQLLLHLETEFATIKNAGQRKKVQEDLGRKKAGIRRLNERLHGVEQLSTTLEEEEEKEEEEQKEVQPVPAPAQVPWLSEPTSTLRNRFSNAPQITATTTALPTAPTSTVPLEKPSSPQDLEKQLSTDRMQQDQLTTDLLQMSRLLKESSLQFGKHLEDEKPYLEQAATGLDKNVLGMQSTGSKLNKLTKDGTLGWYRTIINIAIIVTLGIVGLIILMLPKLRR